MGLEPLTVHLVLMVYIPHTITPSPAVYGLTEDPVVTVEVQTTCSKRPGKLLEEPESDHVIHHLILPFKIINHSHTLFHPPGRKVFPQCGNH